MEFFKSLNIWHKRGIAALIGGVGGYAYYYYIGCVSGTCAITNNPYISTGYGMLIAVLLIAKPKTEKTESTHGNDNTTTDQKI